MTGSQWERTGECTGRDRETDALRDKLTGALIGLARATEGNEYLLTDSTASVVAEGLQATAGGTDYGADELSALLARVDSEKRKLVPGCYLCASPCGRTEDYDMKNLKNAPEGLRALRLQILSGIQSLAAYACGDETVQNLLYRGLYAVGRDDWTEEELLPIAREVERKNRKS